MKKLLLGLGTSSLVILPLVAVASCSSTISNKELNIQLLSDRTTVTQEMITSSTVKIKEASALADVTEKNKQLIIALSSVFVGVNIDNIGDFEISYGGTEIAPTIILTGILDGKRQNVFPSSVAPDKKTLTTIVSPEPTQTLAISLKETITQDMINEAITQYNSVESLPELVNSLNLVFKGVTEEHLKPSIDGKRVLFPVALEGSGTIILIASPDYKFADNSTILKAVPRDPIIPPVNPSI